MNYSFVKNGLDKIGAFIGIIFLAPFFLITAAAIKWDSPGPVFADIPERVGKEGRVFKMYKFRSMIKDAHILLRTDRRFREFYRLYKKKNFKIRTDDDPRITFVGKIIRKTSIDEIPQLINVLRGEMSLVGPRAFHVDELEEQKRNFPRFAKYVETALTVKPGVTGPWQVSGRSRVDFPDRIKLDADYAKRQSFMLDLKILLKTIPALFRGEGY